MDSKDRKALKQCKTDQRVQARNSFPLRYWRDNRLGAHHGDAPTH